VDLTRIKYVVLQGWQARRAQKAAILEKT
jgi:hypothetical protein